MPLYHCTKCHHEWEGGKRDNICAWCKAKGYILRKKTALESMDVKRILERFKNVPD
jgi:hypothetical protein